MKGRTHKVSADAILKLGEWVESEVQRLGLIDEWRKYVCEPENWDELQGDYDWPLRMVVWLGNRIEIKPKLNLPHDYIPEWP